MMAFFQSETGKVPCSFAHSSLEEYLLKWWPKYHSESVFLLLNDQGCNGSRRSLLILVGGHKLKIILGVRLFVDGYNGSLFQALGNQVFYLTIVRTPFELRNNSFHYFAKILDVNDSKFRDHFFNPVF